MNHLQETYGDPLFIPVEGPSREGGGDYWIMGAALTLIILFLKLSKTFLKTTFSRVKKTEDELVNCHSENHKHW